MYRRTDFTSPNPYVSALRGVERTRDQADVMAQDAMQPLQGQVVSGHYVPPSITQGLAKMLKAYNVGKGRESADEREESITAERQKAMVDALRGNEDVPELLRDPNYPDLQARMMGNPDLQPFALQQMIADRQRGDKLEDAKALIDHRAATGVDKPANIAEWEAFSAMTPEDQARYLTMRRANPYLNLGGQMVQPNPVRPGEAMGEFAVTPKPEQMPGFKAEQTAAVENAKVVAEREAEAPKRELKARLDEIKLEGFNEELDNAIALAGKPKTTGIVGSTLSGVKGTNAFALSKALGTIKANIGFDRLQQMREASPTGGALGQVAVQELEGLQNSLTALDQGLEGEDLVAALQKVQQHYARWNDVMKEYRARLDGSAATGANPMTPGAGMDISRDQSKPTRNEISWDDL